MPETLASLIDNTLAGDTIDRSGMAAYASILDRYEKTQKKDKVAAEHKLIDTMIRLAMKMHCRSLGKEVDFLVFSDGANECLFDADNQLTVMMFGKTREIAANTRDNAYHNGYPRAGDGLDKGHALSHAQGGLEGGPNYFRQLRSVNQGRSDAGKLWRAIETYLAANAGILAFVRLIYDQGVRNEKASDQPTQVEYTVMAGRNQFRSVIFPNR
ncbi:hypothetical protein [Azospirillum argentinense]